MGCRKLPARPRHHAQATGAVGDFKKLIPAQSEAVAPEKAIAPDRTEVWFADEARVGQKTRITRCQARHPPPFPQDRPPRRTSAPPPPASLARSVPATQRPQGVRREMRPPDSFLIRFTLPLCNTQATGLHLACIWPGSRAGLPPHVMPCSCLIRQAGTCRTTWSGRQTSPCCRCQPNARNSVRSRTSGSSGVTPGCQTEPSPARATSPIIAATLGTASKPPRRAALPSEWVIGPMGCDR